MTKKELIELNRLFAEFSELGDTQFKYSILKNIAELKPSLEVLVKVEEEISNEIKEFQTDRNNLITELGDKHEDGTISIDPTNEEVIEKFNAEMKKLTDTHKEPLEKYEVKMKEYQTLLEEDIEDSFKFKTLNIDQFPADGISIAQLFILEKHKIIAD